ncbi:3D domain-containing protein [Clostridioides difficile]|uniref:3D domain-containing protein n=1 Tax=Clostridioides difficile TaxID=1496 RepID=UPI00038D172E|nr:3D domain-containing protein [Clostridioides difficile]EQG76141.1 3D domain protein [Clostridioides difficile DA00165]
MKKVVKAEPVNKVVSKGTKVEMQVASSRGESSRRMASSSSSSSSSNNGKNMRVVATAYTGHSITATGTKPKWGTIAVDPKVIPYGTKVYIPQFDMVFTAEDCGGAIKGNKIDIYMNDSKTVYNWGRKTIDIRILK